MKLEQIRDYWKANASLPDKPYTLAKSATADLNALYPNVENLVGKLWLYVNEFDESAIVCEKSRRNRRFINFEKGPLKFCGNQSVCPCNVENFQSKVSSRDESKRQAINKKRASTNLQKYGRAFASQTDDVKAKMAATNLMKYGTISPTQNPTVLEKSRQTCLQNHGVEYPQQNEEIYQKTTEVFLDRYGIKRPAQNEQIRQKAFDTMLEKYGVTNIMKLPEVAEKVRISSKMAKYESVLATRTGFTPLFTAEHYAQSKHDELLPWLCDSCGLQFEQPLMPGSIRCPTCHPTSESWGETELRNFLDVNNVEYQQNDRKIIPPYELDFYIPSQQLAIEFNGIYWHSEQALRDKNYHHRKFQECRDKGIKLIQIFEHELVHKKDIVMDRLSHALSLNRVIIGARACTIKRSSNQDVKQFFNDNHLQSNRPTNLVWSLVNDGKIVAALSVGKARYSKNLAEWEMLRYASLKGHSVPGGLSRLFRAAVTELKAKNFITYANLSWGIGDGYGKLGFKLQRFSDPAPWYFKNVDDVQNRIKFQKHKLDNPSNLSESEWAKANGYNRFWDTGNAVWVWSK